MDDPNINPAAFNDKLQEENLPLDYRKAIETYIKVMNEQDPNNKLSLFAEFQNFFDSFITTDANSQESLVLISDLCHTCISAPIDFDDVNILKISLQMIQKAIKTTRKALDNTDLFEIFYICLSHFNNPEIHILTSSIYTDLFSDAKFFKQYVTQKQLRLLFKFVFIENTDVKLASVIDSIIFNFNAGEIFHQSDIAPFIEELPKLIPQVTNEMKERAAIFITNVASYNEQLLCFFTDRSNFRLYYDMLSHSSHTQFLNNLSLLLCNQDQMNLDIFEHVCEFIKDENYAFLRPGIFDLVFSFLKSHDDWIDDVNDAVPLISLVYPEVDIYPIVRLMLYLDHLSPVLISPFFPKVFEKLAKNEATLEIYIAVIHMIEHQIVLRKTSLSQLFENNFFGALVYKPSQEILSQLSESIDTFTQLILDIYSLPAAEKEREKVFNSLLCTLCQFSQNSSIIAAFLVVSPTEKNLSLLMEHVQGSKTQDLKEALCNTFSKSAIISELFIKVYGINWIRENVTDPDLFYQFISSLIASRRFEEIETLIQELPPDHPLLHISKEKAKSLVFAIDDFACPIRIYSLFGLIDIPEKIDPFNQWILGNNYLDTLDDVQKFPLIKQIANRFIHNRHLTPFLRNPDLLPDLYDKEGSDHFPLFQFYPNVNKYLTIKQSFVCVSFWVRMDSVLENVIIPFCTIGELKITMNGNELIVKYGETKISAMTDSTKWNFIMISMKGMRASHKVKVTINNTSGKINHPSRISEFKSISFGGIPIIMYLGSAIRMSSKMRAKNTKALISKGPNFLGSSGTKWETFVFTPYQLTNAFQTTPGSYMNIVTDTLSVPANVFGVPYFPFTYFFSALENFQLLLHTMENADDAEKFQKHLDFLMDVYQIVEHDVKGYENRILIGVSKCSKFVQKETIKRIVNIFVLALGLDRAFLLCLKHAEMWKSINNDYVFYALFGIIDKIGKETLNKFIKMIPYMINKNPTSKFIILSIFLSHEILADAMSDVLDLFKVAAILYPFESKGTQTDFEDHCERHEESFETTQVNERYSDVQLQCELPLPEIATQEFPALFILKNQVDLQQTYIAVFNELLERKQDISVIMTFLPFEEFKAIFISAAFDFRANLVSLLKMIERMYPQYIKLDHIFLIHLTPLISYHQVWSDCIEIVNSNPSYISLLVALIWGASIVITHSICTRNHDPSDIESCVFEALRTCTQRIDVLIADQLSSSFMFHWYPLIFNIRVMDALFELDIVGTVLRAAGMSKEPFTYMESFKKWAINTPIIRFFIDILYEAPANEFTKFLQAFTFIDAIADKGMLILYLEHFLHFTLVHFSEFYKKTIPFDQFFSFISYLIGKGYITNPSFVILDILELLKAVAKEDGIDKIRTFSSLAHPIISNLILSVHSYHYEYLFNAMIPYLDVIKSMINSTRSMKIYMNIFQHEDILKSPSFKTFFEKFAEQCKLDKRDKVVQSIFNQDVPEKFAYEDKMKKQRDKYDKQLVKAIKHKTEQHANFMSESYASFTAFTKEYKTAVNAHEEIKERFQTSFRTYNDNFSFYEENNRFQDIQGEIMNRINKNDVKKHLLVGFSKPETIPMLRTPSPFGTREEVFEFMKENNMYSPDEKPEDTYQTLKSVFSPKEEMDCELLRMQNPIHCVVFSCEKEYVIVPFTSISPKFSYIDNVMPNLVADFVESAMIGQWGSVTVCHGRLLIRIPHDSIVMTTKRSNNAIFLSTLLSGNFILIFTKSCNAEMLQLSPVIQIPNVEESISLWKAGKISNTQLILYLNKDNLCFFIDAMHQPVFPPDLTVFGLANSDSIELPENRNKLIEFISTKFMINIKEISNSKIHKKVTHTDATLTSQKLETTCRIHPIVCPDHIIMNLPEDAILIDEDRELFINLDTSKFVINIYCSKTETNVFHDKCYLYGFATHIASTPVFGYFIVDFSFGSSKVYKLTPNGKFALVSSVQWNFQPISAISGSHLVCATTFKKTLIIWDINTKIIYRTIELENPVLYINFNDNLGALWIVLAGKLLFLNLQGEILCESPLEKRPTAFTTSENEKCAFVGFDDGTVTLYSPSYENKTMSTLTFKHPCEEGKTCSIKHISIDKYGDRLVTIDNNGTVAVWTCADGDAQTLNK